MHDKIKKIVSYMLAFFSGILFGIALLFNRKRDNADERLSEAQGQLYHAKAEADRAGEFESRTESQLGRIERNQSEAARLIEECNALIGECNEIIESAERRKTENKD